MRRKLILSTSFLLLLLLVVGCGGANSVDNPKETGINDTPDQELTQSDMSTVEVTQTAMPEIGEEIVVLETSGGTIKARLFPDAVPETYKNFVWHIEEGNYDGTIFHRIIKDFMIQGGDIEGLNGVGGYSYKGPGTKIGEEFHPGLSHIPGALSMAKTMFPGTTGSQFFIVQKEDGTDWLDNQHSVFGQVFEGMDIVNQLAAVEVGPQDKPVVDVVLEKVTLETYEG